MMEWFNILRARLRALFLRESVLRDIEEELRVHVEIETEMNIKRGMAPDEARAAARAPQWFRMLVLGLFAILSLVFAAVGVFGAVAYSVTQRVHEIGVRVALGAKPRDILLLTIRQAIAVATIGLAIGLLGSLGLTHFLRRFLYGVTPTDFATFVIACALLTATALLACYLPARRAARVDTVVALKHE
jgi:putative ABC transport system permease protein